MATFIWPTDTKRVTSHFRGNRHDHNGTDIAEGGYHPIYAVADGRVRRSYTSSSYGECIMIEHEINGDTWESVYAHMKSDSRTVFAGDRVRQGQQIGIMGNTGDSTGQHLHFELHRGNWNINKSDAVDPLDYLDKNIEKSINELAEEVIAGKRGTGAQRKKSLGDRYEAVQSRVNEILLGNKSKEKSIAEMAQEVIDGKHGNGHENRRKSLGISKSEYDKVRAEVNRLVGGKSIEEMADEIIAGKHGNGHDARRKSLGISEALYEKVRREVNSRF